MNKLERFLQFFIPLIIISIILSIFIEIKTVLALFFSLSLLMGYSIYKEKIGQELIIAFIIALAWTSYYFYEYTNSNIFLGKINLYSLVAWTFGLVLLREIYERLRGKWKFAKICAVYLIGLLIAEYIGYYLLNIRLNNALPGLFWLEVIHVSALAKIFYVTIGPIYILITDYLKVK